MAPPWRDRAKLADTARNRARARLHRLHPDEHATLFAEALQHEPDATSASRNRAYIRARARLAYFVS